MFFTEKEKNAVVLTEEQSKNLDRLRKAYRNDRGCPMPSEAELMNHVLGSHPTTQATQATQADTKRVCCY